MTRPIDLQASTMSPPWAPSPGPASATPAARGDLQSLVVRIRRRRAPRSLPRRKPVGLRSAGWSRSTRPRLGHLWRRRLDPRPHPPHRQAHHRRDHAQAGGPPHLRAALREMRSIRWCAKLLGGGHPPHRRPARRPAGLCSAAPISRAPTATPTLTELTAGIARIAPFEITVSLYPQKHPEKPVDRPGHRRAEGAKVDAGRHPRPDPVLLRHRRLPALPRAGAQGRDHHPHLAGDSCSVSNFKGLQKDGRALACIPLPDWLGEACSTAWIPDP